LSKNIVLALSIIINLIGGLYLAHYMGATAGGQELNTVYLTAACSDKTNFQTVLEQHDIDHLEIPEDEKEAVKAKWVKSQLSLCNNLKSSSQ
jgi:hypothetical protein